MSNDSWFNDNSTENSSLTLISLTLYSRDLRKDDLSSVPSPYSLRPVVCVVYLHHCWNSVFLCMLVFFFSLVFTQFCRCKPFPELDKTGEELDLLGQLYGLFQKFIRFDKRFRDTLWAEVDLDNTNKEVTILLPFMSLP